MLRPDIAWTENLSSSFQLHFYLSYGIGNISAELNEEGKKRSLEEKYPNSSYSDKDLNSDKIDANEEEQNQEDNLNKVSDITRRFVAIQSILGLATDRFQISGEFIRTGGKKIIVASRIDRLKLENYDSILSGLQSHNSGLEVPFSSKLGIGVINLNISGIDLDGEKVEEKMIRPVSELNFYWRI